MSTPLETPDFARIRLFVEAGLEGGVQIELDKGQTHYLANVMRQSVGSTLLVFNGRDGEWLAKISHIGKRQLSLVLEKSTREQTTTPDLELLFAPIKKLRLDFLVQKATELGVSSIRPVITRFTNAKVNADRMSANVIEAAEQCGRLDVPEIAPAIKLPQLLEAWDAGRTLVFCDEASDAVPMTEALAATASGPYSLLIGPEGGFDADERAGLRAHSATLAVSLGPRIMRADTAALAALAVFQAVKGDWTGSSS